MVTVDQAIIARLKTHGQNFEILVDCSNALALKEGRNLDMHDVLAAMKVFSDAKKGLDASETSMKQIFGTSDADEVAKQIIQKGEIQLTQEYREQLREDKRKQIMAVIHRNGVDPKTHLPHPPQRIENAFLEAKIHIDEFKPVQEQVQDALKKLRPILPIRFEVKEIAIKISPDYAPKCYATVKQFGTILREEWQTSGYWVAVVEMPGGMENDFYDKLNKICHGNVESKVLKIK
ncbi:ribosome assembly factor SBDS [Candidatus Woesearchaeota archaeon]|jgi:ribosome maturation protein SDO1|nr:ribosome assembly factor SBDS [Candidatus Woesearchaeota archaeon]|tara:strand:- start:2450 stop:3151 length:702 start_codon:yes stop_codon:yes gene_type:complete